MLRKSVKHIKAKGLSKLLKTSSSSCNNTRTKQTKLQYCYDWWILSTPFMAGFETGQESVIHCKYKVRDQSP